MFAFCLTGDSKKIKNWCAYLSNKYECNLFILNKDEIPEDEKFKNLYALSKLMHLVRSYTTNKFVNYRNVVFIDVDKTQICEFVKHNLWEFETDRVYLEIHNNPYEFRGQEKVYARSKLIYGLPYHMFRLGASYYYCDVMYEGIKDRDLHYTLEEIILYCFIRTTSIKSEDIEIRDKEYWDDYPNEA